MNDSSGAPELRVREPAFQVALTLYLLGGVCVIIGSLLLFGSSSAPRWWVWPMQPVTAALAGACFLGAVPLLIGSAPRRAWAEVRIAILPSALLVATLMGVSLRAKPDFGGSPLHLLVTVAWWLGLIGLAAMCLLALVMQTQMRGTPAPRRVPIVRWALPLLAVLGAALFGLGVALIGGPDFWGALVPWQVGTADAGILGAWGLALGAAVLGALTEDDLARVRSGLTTLIAVGLLCAVALLWHADDVIWTSWSAAALLALLLGLVAAGLIGRLLLRSATITLRRTA